MSGMRLAVRTALVRPAWIIAFMLAAIGVVSVAAYWDEERESKAALEDFAQTQVTLATSLSQMTTSLDADARERLSRVEEPGSLLVLLSTRRGLERPSADVVRSAPIERAVAAHEPFARLSRPEAAALGLPARTALAGIARRAGHDERGFDVVVVATALRERDREIRASTRLGLALLSSTALVLAFGTLALRRQRAELRLARDLAVADARSASDERLTRADRLATLGALATGIAHEVSTPLGVIMGRAEQLSRKVAGDERAEHAATVISQQADRIGKIVRAFLGLVRGDAGLREHALSVDIVEDARDLVTHRFEQAGVVLASEPFENASPAPSVFCEPKLLTQVLVNLLLNACDACEAGGSVVIAVSSADGRVSFTVRDDGHGITKEDAARAMEPFFTTKPPGKGTGLGLAIASEIVSHHNGTLTLTPRTDGVRGTVARVEVAEAGKESDDES